jgi:hypothetical protein
MLVPLVVLSFKISWNYFESEREEDLSNTRPEWFLVVVITSGKSELVFLEDLEQYKQKNPNCTFLVPSGKKDLINYQLEIAQKDRRGKGTPQINVQDLGDGKQLIEVEILGDGFIQGPLRSEREGSFAVKRNVLRADVSAASLRGCRFCCGC